MLRGSHAFLKSEIKEILTRIVFTFSKSESVDWICCKVNEQKFLFKRISAYLLVLLEKTNSNKLLKIILTKPIYRTVRTNRIAIRLTERKITD